MKNFLKYTFASILGTMITLLLVIFFFIAIIGAISSSTEKVTTVKNNSILKVTLGNVVERELDNPFAAFSFDGENKSTLTGLNKIISSINAAKDDEKIRGIYLDAASFNFGGLAAYESIREALVEFKSSGKFIYSYGEFYSQKAYYLASVADKVFLNPMGAMEIRGMSAQLMFFKKAMDNFGVDMQIVRGSNNKFKSAVEPFIYEKMSEENREQMMVFMGSIWGNMVKQMTESRNISPQKFNEIADSLIASNPIEAKKYNLIDDVVYYDEVVSSLMEKVGVEKESKLNFISLAEYSKTVKRKSFSVKDKIAVIYAVGEIQSGVGNDEIIGSERIVKAVAEARKDSAVKAIVLRVNSPGGSALASEVMWRELVIAKNTKPLVVSMGDYAASGGYYIACMADKIVAQPNTLTGSIGVFGMIPNAQELLNDKIGITTDEVSTNANGVMGFFSPLSPFQLKTIQMGVDRTYNTFISHVAEGRNMKIEDVDAIGQGRVWSGANAKEIGLVDELGSLDDALEIAANLAGIENYRVKELPEIIDPIEEFIKQLGGNAKVKLIKNELGTNYKYYNYFKSIQQMDECQARLPFFIELN